MKESIHPVTTIVIGSLNTDLIATGLQQFPKAGEHVYGDKLLIGPGGKSRNIADMIAHLAPKGSVAMIGKTVRDEYGLWRPPVDALKKAGVVTQYVKVLKHEDAGKLPGIALIPVDQQGNNQIIVLPGVSSDFSPQDIDDAEKLFRQAGENNGVLVLTLECPIPTILRAIDLAKRHNLKIMLDPGGLEAGVNIDRILEGLFFIKPNEHEAAMLTGIQVVDFASAQLAAERLQQRGVQHVLITAGAHGAYLFSPDDKTHIVIPEIKVDSEKDETGCGDQTMAALCALVQSNESIGKAASQAVAAGTLQFQRVGIQPVTAAELNRLEKS